MSTPGKILALFQRLFFTWLVKRKVRQYESPLRVNGKTIVNRNTFLGKNIHFNGLQIQGKGKVVIGDNFHSGTECMLITEIHNYDGGTRIPYDHSTILKPITIEDNVWLGNRVIILGGNTIGEGAIIQAGAVVVSDIPPYGIAGGNPAKVFKNRDIDHYERLKKEGKFH